MLLPPYSSNELLRLIRKFAGLNQTEMAEALGVTQSTLSRLESGMGDLNLEQLGRLRSKFGIGADALLDGVVPLAAVAKKFGSGVAMPEEFSVGAGLRMFHVYPFLRLLVDRLGRQKATKVIESLQVDPIVLADGLLPVNLRFLFCLLDVISQRGFLQNRAEFQRLVDFAIAENRLEGRMGGAAGGAAPVEIMQGFIDRIAAQQREFVYQIRKAKTESLDLLFEVPSWVQATEDGIRNAGKILCKYQRELVQRLGSEGMGRAVRVEEDRCQFDPKPSQKSSGGCLYHLSWS